jgi:soluble lytic murein transglycosylase-like protein
MKIMKHFFTISFLFITVFGVANANSNSMKVYKHIDKSGVIHYSSKKPNVKKFRIINVKCPECGWKNQVNWSTTPLVKNRFEREIQAAAKKWAIEPSLIKAVIHAESSFIANNQSSVGAQGLMQLMPATQKIYAVTNPFDPKQNIQAGTAYLKHLMDVYNNDITLSLAAYNAGEGAVKKYKNSVPPYEETRNYINRVKILQKRYK